MNITDALVNYEQNRVALAFQSASLFIIILAGMLGNFLVIRSIFEDMRMQTVGNILVFNVSMADFAMSAVMLFSVVALLAGSWPFGHTVCSVNVFFASMFTRVGLLTLVLATYDKYRTICRKIYPNLSKNCVYVIIGIWWTLGALSSVPYPGRVVLYRPEIYHCVYDKRAEIKTVLKGIDYITSSVEIASFLLIAFCLWRINKAVWQSRNVVAPVIMLNETQVIANTQEYTAYTTTIVLCAYVALVLPRFISETLIDIGIVHYISPGLQVVFYWVFCCHCVLKPVIYAMRSERCMEYLKSQILRLPCYQKFQQWKRRTRMDVYRIREDSQDNYRQSHSPNSQLHSQSIVLPTQQQSSRRLAFGEFTDLSVIPYEVKEFEQEWYKQNEQILSTNSLNTVPCNVYNNRYSIAGAKTVNRLNKTCPTKLAAALENESWRTEDDRGFCTESEFYPKLHKESVSDLSVDDGMVAASNKEQFGSINSINTSTNSLQGNQSQSEVKRRADQTLHAVEVIIHSDRPRAAAFHRTSSCRSECERLQEEIELETLSGGSTFAGELRTNDEPETNYKVKKMLRTVPLQMMLPSVALIDDECENNL